MKFKELMMYLENLYQSTTRASLLVSLLASVTLSSLMETICTKINIDEVVFSLLILTSLVCLASIFIIADMVTGIIASLKEGSNLNSNDFGTTVGKFFGLCLFYCIGAVLITLVSGVEHVDVLVFIPVILTTLKEYISIGENLERRLGKEIYIFTLVTKTFNLIENKFFKIIENILQWKK